MWLIVSSIAAVLTTISFLPQAIKAIQKNTKSISLLMYVVFTLGVSAWSVYAIVNHNIALAAANIIGFILAVTILSFKIKNILRGTE